jgi:cell wall-associated NlpC family hydrolase
MKCNAKIIAICFILIACLTYSCSSTKKVQSSVEYNKDNPKEFSINGVSKSKLKAWQNNGFGKQLNTAGKNEDDLIKAAKKYMGTKHCMGGVTKKCIDCSGLLFASFRDIGVKFARTADDQARYGNKITDRDKLKKGDLVFFVNTYNTSKLITHSGIYLGDGKFIHTSSKKGVSISDIYDKYYWSDKFAFGTRIF